MAYSSISHMGFALMGLAAGTEQVIGHQCLQRRRGARRGHPVEADLVVGLDDPGPHVRLHSMTRLLPESATARVSPRNDSP